MQANRTVARGARCNRSINVSRDPRRWRETAPDVPSGWVTTTTLVEVLGLDPDWVYDNVRALGARRVGDGSKARLVFDVGGIIANHIERMV